MSFIHGYICTEPTVVTDGGEPVNVVTPSASGRVDNNFAYLSYVLLQFSSRRSHGISNAMTAAVNATCTVYID